MDVEWKKGVIELIRIYSLLFARGRLLVLHNTVMPRTNQTNLVLWTELRLMNIRWYTVPATSVVTKPNLCTKQPVFNKLVWIIKVPTHSSPQISTLALTGASKWDTVWTSTSTGIGIVKGQSLNFQIYLIKNKYSTLTFHNSCASAGRSSYSTSF